MRRYGYACVAAALCRGVLAAAGLLVDAEVPAGNIVVERIEGDRVEVRQEWRGSTQWWFYWAFRVRGAEGRTLTFAFTDGEPVGMRGPAVSGDRGLTWRWLEREFTTRRFSYAFAAEEREVWFAFGPVYTQREWDRFARCFEGSPYVEEGRLAVTRKGRLVEKVRVGCVKGEPRYRVLLTARHHCCEMLGSYAVEGVVAAVLGGDERGEWLRRNVELLVVPFVDKDGVEDGDQGKYRGPRDHNRDYGGTSVHVETAALRELVPAWAGGRLAVALDLHCPWIRGAHNDRVYQVGSGRPEIWAQQQAFGRLLEGVRPSPLAYRQADDLPFGQAWNTADNFSQGVSVTRWAGGLEGVRLASSLEIPYATANGRVVDALSARAFGDALATALWRYLAAE